MKKDTWVNEFFNNLYYHLFMKRSDEQIEKEAKIILQLSQLNINKEQHNISTEKLKVLDVCCGVGDIGQYLTQYATVSGIELSTDYKEQSLLVAPNVKFYNESALYFKTEEKFDVVYNWYSSFAYFDDLTNKTLLNNCYDWTKNDGVFLLEIYNSYKVLKNFLDIHEYNQQFNGKKYDIKRKSNIDWKTRKLNQQWSIIEDGNLIKTHDTYTIIYLIDELVKMIENIGFTDVEVFGRDDSGQLQDFSVDSSRLIIKAKKR